MFSKFNLWELLVDGFSEIRIGQNFLVSIFYHFVLPLSLSFILILFQLLFDNDIISNTVSSISIFSGLLFSVIFILLENYNRKKEKIDKNSSDELVNYLERYKTFTNQITTRILFLIAIAMMSVVFLILLMVISKMNKAIIEYEWIKEIGYNIKKIKIIILYFLQTISIILLFNYFLVVINLIKEVYTMVYDSINSDIK